MYGFLPLEAADYDPPVQNNDVTDVNCNDYDNQDEQDAGVATNSCWRWPNGDGTTGDDPTDDDRYNDHEEAMTVTPTTTTNTTTATVAYQKETIHWTQLKPTTTRIHLQTRNQPTPTPPTSTHSTVQNIQQSIH